MPHVSADRWYDAPRSRVWEIVTDPTVYASVAPNLASVEVLEGSGEGMVRRCVDVDGNEWTETCRCWDEGRSFAVEVDTKTSDFHRRLFRHFEGTWRLTAESGGVRVSIRFDFEPRYGVLGRIVTAYLRYRAPAIFEVIFDGWAAELEAINRQRDRVAWPPDGLAPSQSRS